MPCIATCGQGWRGGCSLVTRVEAKQLCGHLRRDRQSRLRWRRVRQSRHRQRRRHRIRTRVAGADHPRRRLLPEACPREGSVPAPRFPGTASARAWRFPTQTPWPPKLPPTRRTLPPSKRQRRAPQPQPGWRERKKPHYSTTTTTMTTVEKVEALAARRKTTKGGAEISFPKTAVARCLCGSWCLPKRQRSHQGAPPEPTSSSFLSLLPQQQATRQRWWRCCR
mmetsp:Transcript_31506/g.62907  ORF Transcript_31506/g.62907 Transcript_31506/m.62907 type:complete len:223 (+) Transcript_31506:123-791(+)